MQTPKEKYVADIAAGEHLKDIFALAEKNMARKRDGSPFLTLVLADRTGRIRGVVWDNVAHISAAAKTGDFVSVDAAASEYQGKLQLVVKTMAAVAPESVVSADFLPATTRDIDQMFERLRTLTDSITAPALKSLMSAFWEDDAFVRQFKQAPAAKMMHHAYIGGLLEHTLSMALLADRIAGHYGGVDRDLLVVGAVLHDIGKVRELTYSQHIDYTDEGRLLSHLVIGLEMACTRPSRRKSLILSDCRFPVGVRPT